MIKTFTPDDLLKYLYNETSKEETKEIEKALKTYPKLRKEYKILQADLQLLEGLEVSPSKAPIEHVLQYASVMNLKALVN